MVGGGVCRAEPVQDCGEGADDDGEDECQQADFGLVDAVAAFGETRRLVCRSRGRTWEGVEGAHDLVAVYVGGGLLRPVVGACYDVADRC